jgi:hypothetical protein
LGKFYGVLDTIRDENPAQLGVISQILSKLKIQYQHNERIVFLFSNLLKYINGEPDIITPPVINNLTWDENNFKHIYKVGDGQDYSDLNQIPRESLEKSTLILVYRRAEPYQNKFVINAAGTENEPIVIL